MLYPAHGRVGRVSAAPDGHVGSNLARSRSRSSVRDLLLAFRVPSQQHEILVEMFRTRPALARELLEQVAHVTVGMGTAELAPNDLSQTQPVEYRADAVTVIRDAHGLASSAVIVEVQLHVDRDKGFTWPLYVAALRARVKCPVVLLVLTPDDGVAQWARTPIAMGHPRFELCPIVVGFAELPHILDRELARQVPELGVLSVMAHRDLAVALVVGPEILGQPSPMRQVYLDLIYSALPDAARRVLKELLMQKYEYQSDIVRGYVAQGREEGLAEGREQGREEGRAEVLHSALAKIVLAKLGNVPPHYEQAWQTLNTAALEQLLVNLSVSSDASEVAVLFGRLIAPSETST
jgi:hypothetical protein